MDHIGSFDSYCHNMRDCGIGNIFTVLTYVKEITIVATWVFVWSAVEMLFFDSNRLKKRKYNLLHILSARITIDDSEPKQE